MFRARRAASRGHNFLSLPRPRSPAVLGQNGPARPMRVRLGGDMDDMHAFFFSADLEADPFLGYRMGVRDPLRRHDLSLADSLSLPRRAPSIRTATTGQLDPAFSDASDRRLEDHPLLQSLDGRGPRV